MTAASLIQRLNSAAAGSDIPRDLASIMTDLSAQLAQPNPEDPNAAANIKSAFFGFLTNKKLENTRLSHETLDQLLECIQKVDWDPSDAATCNIITKRVLECYKIGGPSRVESFKGIVGMRQTPFRILYQALLLSITGDLLPGTFKSVLSGVQETPPPLPTLKALQYIFSTTSIVDMPKRCAEDFAHFGGHDKLRRLVLSCLESHNLSRIELGLQVLKEIISMSERTKKGPPAMAAESIGYIHFLQKQLVNLFELAHEEKINPDCSELLFRILASIPRVDSQKYRESDVVRWLLPGIVYFPNKGEVRAFLSRPTLSLVTGPITEMIRAAPKQKDEMYFANLAEILITTEMFNADVNSYFKFIQSLGDPMTGKGIEIAFKRRLIVTDSQITNALETCLLSWMKGERSTQQQISTILQTLARSKTKIAELVETHMGKCRNPILLAALSEFFGNMRREARKFVEFFADTCSVPDFGPAHRAIVKCYAKDKAQPISGATLTDLIAHYFPGNGDELRSFCKAHLHLCPRYAVILSAWRDCRVTRLRDMAGCFGQDWPQVFSDIVKVRATLDLECTKRLFSEFVEKGNDKTNVRLKIDGVVTEKVENFMLKDFLESFYNCCERFSDGMIRDFNVIVAYKVVTSKHIGEDGVRSRARRAALKLLEHLSQVPIDFALYLMNECMFGRCSLDILRKCHLNEQIVQSAIRSFMVSLGTCVYDPTLVATFVALLPAGQKTIDFIVHTILDGQFTQTENIVMFTQKAVAHCLAAE